MSNGLHNDVLNGKNCLKRFLFDQNFALQGLYFDQNFEKCTLVARHFILNQIFKKIDMSQAAAAGRDAEGEGGGVEQSEYGMAYITGRRELQTSPACQP